ncbi:hypothetical protein [Paenibacillus sp. NPDC058177]|uniref:hypothetical protein n=1 Tax=Paenibacillus sp. NPDC058177 TaxID=3346369 RepID=UPI0036DDC000
MLKTKQPVRSLGIEQAAFLEVLETAKTAACSRQGVRSRLAVTYVPAPESGRAV